MKSLVLKKKLRLRLVKDDFDFANFEEVVYTIQRSSRFQEFCDSLASNPSVGGRCVRGGAPLHREVLAL